MILIDNRVGSADLAAPLKQMGLPVELTHLEYGDLAFEGKGEGGRALDIGIELKRLGDLVGSLRSGRLAGHQLPGLRGCFDHIWLIVEGRWRRNAAGQIVINRGRPLPGGMSASELEKHILTLELCGGCHVRYTPTRRDTLHFIAALVRWWQDKSLDRHTTHLAIHTPASFLPISDFRATVSRLPGIGLKASAAVESYFSGSLRRAVNASVEEWAAIQTIDTKGKPRRLGTAVAARIVDFCKGSTIR